MKAVCVKQPWAWLIFHGKDIENRTWATKHRGSLLIAASAKTPTAREMADAIQYAKGRGVIVPLAKLRYGGVIGKVELVSCVYHSESRWFMGPIGWVLRNPVELAFVPIRGQLSIFDLKWPEVIQPNAGP